MSSSQYLYSSQLTKLDLIDLIIIIILSNWNNSDLWVRIKLTINVKKLTVITLKILLSNWFSYSKRRKNSYYQYYDFVSDIIFDTFLEIFYLWLTKFC